MCISGIVHVAASPSGACPGPGHARGRRFLRVGGSGAYWP